MRINSTTIRFTTPADTIIDLKALPKHKQEDAIEQIDESGVDTILDEFVILTNFYN